GSRRLRRGASSPAAARHRPGCFARRPLFEGLEPRLMLSGDNLNGATTILLDGAGNGSAAGAIAGAGVVDLYRFIAPYSGPLRIGMSALPGSALDSFIELDDASGNVLGFDDNTGGGLNSLLNFPEQVAGRTYYVRASSTNGKSGAYALRFTGPQDL